jgi:hypothetical protein
MSEHGLTKSGLDTSQLLSVFTQRETHLVGGHHRMLQSFGKVTCGKVRGSTRTRTADPPWR